MAALAAEVADGELAQQFEQASVELIRRATAADASADALADQSAAERCSGDALRARVAAIGREIDGLSLREEVARARLDNAIEAIDSNGIADAEAELAGVAPATSRLADARTVAQVEAEASDARAVGLEDRAEELRQAAEDLRWRAQHDPIGTRVPRAIELIRMSDRAALGFGGRVTFTDEIAEMTSLPIAVVENLIREHGHGHFGTLELGHKARRKR